MNRVLVMRSLRDGWILLARCSGLTLVLFCLRVWFTSRIRIEHFLAMLADGLDLFKNLLPVSLEDWTSPLGRTVFSYEEPTVVLLLGLWTIARGSDCIAGRVGSGTMEMQGRKVAFHKPAAAGNEREKPKHTSGASIAPQYWLKSCPTTIRPSK